ncbi:MAG: fatty acid desaturase [Rhodospirillaceae bacterium]|nr:fatty acid desaturase [Rhodospirillaceae bacterium]
MADATNKNLRELLAPYVKTSVAPALGLFVGDLGLHYGFLAGALLLEDWPLRLVCAIAAGAAISQLFVIGHDAVHGAYLPGKVPNQLVGRIAFWPALHNFSLWRIAHNRMHHRETNVRDKNSWSPLAPEEFAALSGWRKALYRLYRSPLGLGPYYLTRRWWKDKFFPTTRMVGKGDKSIYWADFILNIAYLVAWLSVCLAAAPTKTWSGIGLSLLFGFVVPYAMWNYLMGFTTYFQHTHPRVPWFRDEEAARRATNQADVSVHLKFPAFYGLISHHIMDHPAHHVNPKVPLYRLKAAQAKLNEALGERAVIDRFTPFYLFRTMGRCKLYDYARHRWLDFGGTAIDVALPRPRRTAGPPKLRIAA